RRAIAMGWQQNPPRSARQASSDVSPGGPVDKQRPLDDPVQYWYDTPDAIEHLFCGVFEGGGAKGVAYSGALLAMAQEKCWFSAVAGASAGAITAALVASGLSPKDMETKTDEALRLVQTGVWAGLRRLRKTTGYFQSDDLRTWLNELLSAQVQKSDKSGAAVSFEELYAATRIELNIVATDLSLGTQVIFSHIDTPKCAVADAVVASSSIPFAFTSRLLQVVEGESSDRLSHHTIVDGGVWSNFPMHIFEDEAFRRFYGRVPEKIESACVLGFLLQEHEEQAGPHGGDVRFVDEESVGFVRAREWISDSKTEVDARPGLGSRIGALVLYPFSLLGRFVERNSKMEPGRWPTPRSPLARRLVQSIDGLLVGTYPPVLGVLGFGVVVVGAWQVISFLGIDQLNALQATDWSDLSSYARVPFALLLTLLAVAVAILVVFASLLGFVANFVLLRASRRILYGLVTTYVAGPGAPAWVAGKRNVIALPIPPTVTTLSFEMKAGTREDLIASAKQATLVKLRTLLPEQSLRNGNDG
ncbi:MAG: patatin-like phospholipase family protein, partial [Candidatus Binatia bacterium]